MPLVLDPGHRTTTVALALLAAVTCSCPAPAPVADVGLPHDAGHAVDSGLDAPAPPADAWRPVDADLDAPIPDGDPGWFHAAALPDECPIDLATYPERSAVSMIWTEDCGPGCRSWGNTANLYRVGTVAGAPLAALFADPSAPEERRVYSHLLVVNLDTNETLMALRMREPSADRGAPSCMIFDAGIGSGSVAFTVRFYDYDDTGNVLQREWTGVLRAEVSDPSGTLRMIALQDSGGVMASVMQLSASYVATLWSWAIVRGFGEDGTVLSPTYGLEEFSGSKTNLELLGESDLLWAQWRSPTVLVRSRAGAPPTVLRSVDGGETRGSDIRGFAADGNTLAWLEAHDWNDPTRSFARVELWTGTYGEAGDIVAPRRVADVTQAGEGDVGAGLYVHAEPFPDPTDAFFAFYRLSDGARAVFDPSPDSRGANRVLYVSDDMVITESFGQKYWIDPRELTFEAP